MNEWIKVFFHNFELNKNKIVIIDFLFRFVTPFPQRLVIWFNFAKKKKSWLQKKKKENSIQYTKNQS